MSASRRDLAILPAGEFQDRIGVGANPYLSVLVEPTLDARVRYTVALWQEAPHPRAIDCVEYIETLAEHRDPLSPYQVANAHPILFQGEDNPSNVTSISWQGHRDWSAIALVPDLYYFRQRGYEDFLPSVPDWSSRRAQLVWRGSSTGLLALTHHRLHDLPRYRLCREAVKLAGAADIKLTSIVQAASDTDLAAIERQVLDENLMGGWVPMEEMAHYRYVVDIDGNANSWNFMMKMRLGACVLKVESEWTQWFTDTLEPWVHYVPVRADLSDLIERVEWCQANDADAAAIAHAGRRLALNMRYEEQMAAAAATLFR